MSNGEYQLSNGEYQLSNGEYQLSNGEYQLSISFAAEWLQTEYRPLSIPEQSSPTRSLSPLESGISPFIFLYLLNMRNLYYLIVNCALNSASIHLVWSRYSSRLEPPSGLIQIHIYTLVFSKFLTRTVCARYARTP